MPKSADPNTRKTYGVRIVHALAISTHSINETFAEMLRPFTAKEIARKLRLPSARTVENWKEAKSSPQAKHVVAMLADDELCALLLANVNPEAAHQVKVAAAEKKLRELKAGK